MKCYKCSEEEAGFLSYKIHDGLLVIRDLSFNKFPQIHKNLKEEGVKPLPFCQHCLDDLFIIEKMKGNRFFSDEETHEMWYFSGKSVEKE
jgi:hypothetical protein